MTEKTPVAIELHCLGAFAVSHLQRAISAFSTDKARALLVYLALETGQPHRREALAGLLWPEMGQSAALNNLRLALHRLRETLDKVQPDLSAHLIQSTRQTIQLTTTRFTVDVQIFLGLLATCAAHSHPQLTECPACHRRLIQAVDLYRGEFLAGFGLADAPAFEEWLLLRRESLHQQLLAALQILVQSCVQAGDDAQAHHYASRQLALDPSREEAHRQLMRILHRRGLRSEALAQYESCRRILREQLAVEPDRETVALYRQIREGKLAKPGVPSVHPPADALPNDQRIAAPEPVSEPAHLLVTSTLAQTRHETPEVTQIYGRQAEQAQLARWLLHAQCRVVALLGMGGLGKTTLAAATVKAVAHHFGRVIWRSLLNAPPLDELLRVLLSQLTNVRLTELPPGLDGQLALLLDQLRQDRCLLVLDNLESILQPEQPGQMRVGYEGYAQLLQTVAEHPHQSVILLTSRERPQGLARREEDSPLVRTLLLDGLDLTAGQAMLTARGLSGPVAHAANLVIRYSGNPLALKLVAQTVQELFGGDIGAFLAVEVPIFDDIRLVLDQQFARLSPLEQELLLWLAVERVPVTAVLLRANLVQPPPMSRFLEALRALQRRSLLEPAGNGFTLQNVVIEYLTERLIEGVCAEIDSELRLKNYELRKPSPNEELETRNSKLVNSFLNRHALLKAQAAEYIRQSQARLILQPVAERLLTKMGKARLAAQIQRLLTTLHRTAPLVPGYAGGNLLNLLLALELEVSNYDFSDLCVWQAYLRGAYLPGLKLAGADLTGAAFTHRFGAIHGFQFRRDGELLLMSFSEGVIELWRAHAGELLQRLTANAYTFDAATLSSDGGLIAQRLVNQTIALVDVASERVIQTLTGDSSSIWKICFSPNGQYVASGHVWGHICVWEVASGRLCAHWQAHTTSITALAFAPDNVHIASGALDSTVTLWHATTATSIHTLIGHTDEVATLGFTPDGATLITGSHDLTVRLWATATGTLCDVLHGHTQLIRYIAIAPNGRWAATGGIDRFVYLWDLTSGKAHQLLADHGATLEQIAFSLDSQTVAVYDFNGTISVWAVASGQRLDSYRLHHAGVNAIAFSPNGHWLVSGGADWALYLWDVSQPTAAQIKARLTGHRQRVYTLAFSPDGETIASGDCGGTIRLWQRQHGTSRVLLGCQGEVRKVTFSPDGQSLASASDDGLRLWSVATGRQTHLLPGSMQGFRVCAFSADGRWLASGHQDHSIGLWALDGLAGVSLRYILRHHTNIIQTLVFSADDCTLFSTSHDQTLCRWDLATGTRQASWSTQHTAYWALAIHPDGRCIASGGGDHLIRLLDSESGEIEREWQGHTHIVESLSFRADGQLLASASQDETIRLWDTGSGACLQVLRTPGPYAGMNIRGVTGLSPAQKAALMALGAMEE